MAIATKADLPPKDVADKLVDCYLQTTETIYRILHVPTLRRDYEALWVSDTEPDTVFLVQLKLVLAIGATTYDEQFSLRASAIQWVYGAQTWFSEPEFKSRLSIQALQTNIFCMSFPFSLSTLRPGLKSRVSCVRINNYGKLMELQYPR